MRKLIFTLVTAAFAAISIGQAAVADVSHKHALLIGISKYEHGPNSTFPDLDCGTDVEALKNVLVTKFGFNPTTDITVLTAPSQTTRSAILNSFTALINKTQPGDVVFFHYSGHGSQVDDPRRTGGLDDTMVPSDWADDGSKDIKDKELNAIVARMSGRHPASFTMSFDCCHSGTITRDYPRRLPRPKVRGVTYLARFHRQPPAQPALDSLHGSAPVERFVDNVVVISACLDNETAGEVVTDDNQVMGRLSYLETQLLRKAGPNTTYQDISDKICSEMREKFATDPQTPLVDGNLNLKLLSGVARKGGDYTPTQLDSKRHLFIEAGTVFGVTSGSRYAIYPNDDSQMVPKNRLAEVVVTRVGSVESQATMASAIKPGVKITSLGGCRAVEIEHVNDPHPLRVDATGIAEIPDAQAILDSINCTLNVVTKYEGSKADVMLTASTNPAEIQVIRVDGGMKIGEVPEDAGAADAIGKILAREQRYQQIISLNNESPDSPVAISMRVVPALAPETGSVEYSGDDTTQKDLTVYHQGSYCTVEVTNNGNTDAYVTVLDLEPNGTATQIWPDKQILDNIVPAGATRKLWLSGSVLKPALFQFSGDSVGSEIFKAVATVSRIDMSAALSRDIKHPPSALAQLLIDSNKGRFTTRQIIRPTDWATATEAVTVIK